MATCDAEEVYEKLERILEFMDIDNRETWLKVIQNDYRHPDKVNYKTALSMAKSLTNYISNVKNSLKLEDADIRELRTLLYKAISEMYNDQLTFEIGN